MSKVISLYQHNMEDLSKAHKYTSITSAEIGFPNI